MAISFPISASSKKKQAMLKDILYNIQWMKKEKWMQRNWLQLIAESGNQISEMVENSLDMFKMEENTYDFNPTPCNLTDIFNKLSSDLGLLVRQKNINLSFYQGDNYLSNDDSFWVSGEYRLLQNLFANLLKNAIEASPSEEEVRVQLDHQKPDQSMIQIHNKGVVPETLRDCFFERYATHGKKSGTGLGTYSAKLIAKTHHGDIQFKTDESEGTTLFVMLPVSKAPVINEKDQKNQHPQDFIDFQLQGKILIAEDNPINQLVLKGLMEDHNVMVDMADNGKEVVQVVERSKYDLILMDMEMPIMDGFEATKIIRKKYSHTELPIIALTAHELDISEVNKTQTLINDIIPKPIQPLHYFTCLKKYLKTIPNKQQPLNVSPPEINNSETSDILNLDRALKQLMGKRQLLENIMQSFQKEHFNAPEAIKKLIENKQFKSAQLKIHTIKGLAGTIGAPMLQKAAQDLETAIRDGMLPKLNQLISSFRQNLDPVIETIEKTLPDSLKKTETPELSDTLSEQLENLEKNINNLYSLLMDSDSEANDACEECLPALSYLIQSTDDNKLLDQLRLNMKGYMFDEASEILKKLSQKLGLELQTH
ncbi:multi-sensor hybrid histidine kinase [Candidatus Magnetomorum sp. HK-1]|nr:multi-sensor hybrid histidine kinase [Candidatus Magnetomorum sp. HK-1]